MARGDLPRRATTFVGRRKELSALRRLLSHTRLLTLVGPGGSGKTRLTAELASSVSTRFPGGVFFVDLSTVDDHTLIDDTVADALQVVSADRNRRRALVDNLAGRSVLLVLDNCEHLLAACASLASALARRCPMLVLIATSRERLNIEGETVWSVPPLSLPDSATVTAADGSDAVRLFVNRARLVQTEFLLDLRNVTDVVAVCRSVDGIPLGVELAAARLATATPAELNAMLRDRLGTLVGGARDVTRRQQAMRTTIAWSHDLLNDAQQVLFRRLAVFAGDQGVDAITDVCAFPPVTPAACRDLLTQLVEKSLVRRRADSDVMRFGMLQPIREFAAQHLHRSGETEALARRHQAFYARLAAQAKEARRHRGARAEHQRLWTEMDDVRAALVESPDAVSFMELAADLFGVWLLYTPHEGFRRLSEAFERLPDPPPRLLARASRTLMMCAGQLGDLRTIAVMLPRYVAAVEEGDVVSEHGHHNLALGFSLERREGDLAGARNAFRKAVAVFDADRVWPDYVLALSSLASVERQLGDFDVARGLIGEALERAVQIDDVYLIVGAYFHRGCLELDEGDVAAALASYVAGLELAERSDRLSIAHQLEGVACALAGSEPRRAARLFGAAERLRELGFLNPQPPWRARLERGIAEARGALAEPVWTREHAAGRELDLDAIFAVARGEHTEPHKTGVVSKREMEVAGLVAAGMTNRDIAAKLFVSERTVESHVDHILTKLQFRSRAQLAAWVASRQV
ncbi:MAG: helix-turn-helix transcriptional regulator [Candidatus Dormibacteria bacterium]